MLLNLQAEADISNAGLLISFSLASLDIVQAVALILSDALQLYGSSLGHAAADKSEFKCSCEQLKNRVLSRREQCSVPLHK